MIYLASPYTHEDRAIMQRRFEQVEYTTAQLIIKGIFVYSPIVHCHQLAHKFNLPKNFDFWKAYNLSFLRRADRFYILPLRGWELSKGLTYEYELAKFAHIFINFVDIEGSITDPPIRSFGDRIPSGIDPDVEGGQHGNS